MDRTLVIVKPDGVERGLAGEVLSRLERKNLRLVAAELRTITREVAETHYAEHAERPFFGDLVVFITRSPALSWSSKGPKDTFAVVRLMMGATNPAEAAPTIRGDYGIEQTENLVHGSDSHESAAREIALFFPARGHLITFRVDNRPNAGVIAGQVGVRWRPPCGPPPCPIACGRTITGAGHPPTPHQEFLWRLPTMAENRLFPPWS